MESKKPSSASARRAIRTQIDLQTATLAELTAERERLLQEKQENNEVLASCRAQIQAAKSRTAESGFTEYADPRWFLSVNDKARFAGQRDQKISHRLAELRQLIHAARDGADQASASLLGADADDPVALMNAGMKLIARARDLLQRREQGQ